MIIRKMTEEDLPAVEKIEQESFTDPWDHQGFLDSLCSPRYTCLLAEEEGTTAGYALMYTVLEESYISLVAVDEKFRRRGTGRCLTEELIREAAERKAEYVLLEVRVSNLPAIRLYESLGFERSATRRNFYDFPREDGFLYRKDLPLMDK